MDVPIIEIIASKKAGCEGCGILLEASKVAGPEYLEPHSFLSLQKVAPRVPLLVRSYLGKSGMHSMEGTRVPSQRVAQLYTLLG